MSVDVLRGPAVPSVAGCQVRATGHGWEAVRAPVVAGQTALALLGEHNGTVIEDPREPALCWFVRQCATARWDVHGPRPLGLHQNLVVPSRCHTRGPGPLWTIQPKPRVLHRPGRTVQSAGDGNQTRRWSGAAVSVEFDYLTPGLGR